MFKKVVIFVSVILVCFGFVDIVFGDMFIKSEQPTEIDSDGKMDELVIFSDLYTAPLPQVIDNDGEENPTQKYQKPYDFDSDGLTNSEEYRLGTDPFRVDTDNDFVIDSLEVKWGTNPLSWDTDGDRLADYLEMSFIDGATSAFSKDSDSDGLPDPWEDNDGDKICNIEEQHPKFKYGILGTNPNEVDSDGDTIPDNVEAQVYSKGPISENSKNYGGGKDFNPTPDRINSELDVSNPNSKLYKHLKNTLGWTDTDLEWWDDGLEQSYKAGHIAENQSNTVWYHYTPLLWPMPEEYNWSTRGLPYRWNKYDTNPAVNDTDGDLMDDDWDPRPLVPDDRLDAYIAITNVKYNNKDYPATAPTNGNFTGGFNANFTALEIQKGASVQLTLWLGLEDTPQNDPIKIPNFWWRPINISIAFGTFQLGADNQSHGDIGVDDFRGDDLWPDVNNTALPRISDKPWVKVDNTNYEGSYAFTNSSGMGSTMYFYSQIVTIFMPADLPAGIIGFLVRANPNTGENFYYESYKWPFVGY